MGESVMINALTERRNEFMDENKEWDIEDLLKESYEDIPKPESPEPVWATKQTTSNRFTMSKKTYYFLLAVFACVFLFSAVYLIGYYVETQSAENIYNDLADLYYQSGGAMNPTLPNGVQETTPDGAEPVILPELLPIYERNNDLVGYLKIDDKMLYPVMQSPGDSDFYLDHDFNRNESISGCPYVPASCDVFEPSDNVVIYGHNMRSGGIFNHLLKYRTKEYWQEHQTFQFDTLYERHTYQIFAVFKTAGKQHTEDGDIWGFPYHRMNDFDTAEEFDQFIADVKGAAFAEGGYQGQSPYDTGIAPKYGDKLLCLSTCEYTVKDPDGTINGRWVVMAVRID